MPLFAATIFLSASLLFLVQPLIAKQILPWFGGSAAVWTTCMVFFQLVLLAGYAYSDQLPRRTSSRGQALVHTALLLASLAFLPIVADPDWKPAGGADPMLRILGLLAATVGLPYFLLSTTGPLVQRWFAKRYPERTVYRLFALSNVGSLLGLLAYPFLIEPYLALTQQAWLWSAAYTLFALACIGAAWRAADVGQPGTAAPAAPVASGPAPRAADYVFWVACAALASVLLLGVTSHLTQNIASIPFLWVLPLTLYLFSFVVVFEGRGGQGWYVRSLWLLPVLAIAVAMAWGLSHKRGVMQLTHAIPLYAAGLFLACVFCHGELAATKPAPRYLTRFYLMLSLGGALGGLAVGLIAPRVFDNYWELPLALIGLALLGVLVAWRSAWGERRTGLVLRALTTGWALAAVAGTGYYGWTYWSFLSGDTIHMSRNFYGTVRIKEAGESEWKVRRMLHGVILHGEQFTDPRHAAEPTSYYGPTSGLGLAIQLMRLRGPVKLCVIGLGTGTAAAWARSGDTVRYYEIDPDIVPLANRYFSYLRDTQAKVEMVIGDGRLSLERELGARQPQQCDVLAVDAFSGDSIPVHLITREAVALYGHHVKPDGILAFHVSNRYLDLQPVLAQLATATDFRAVNIEDEPVPVYLSRTDWVLMSRTSATLAHPIIASHAKPLHDKPIRMWTDASNNLFQVLR
jgi:hypothetical protein